VWPDGWHWLKVRACQLCRSHSTSGSLEMRLADPYLGIRFSRDVLRDTEMPEPLRGFHPDRPDPHPPLTRIATSCAQARTGICLRRLPRPARWREKERRLPLARLSSSQQHDRNAAFKSVCNASYFHGPCPLVVNSDPPQCALRTALRTPRSS